LRQQTGHFAIVKSPESGRQRVSAAIIARNAATQIEACLASLDFADEIVVVDSGSVDRTPEIAEAAGARVIRQAWLGYGPQKRFAVDQASNDWVLCLDADERVSAALRASLLEVLAAPAFRAYEMPRCNRFMGAWLRHGEGYPDRILRLFDRRAARWSDDLVHEKVVTGERIGRLHGDLLHESAESLHGYLEKQNAYTTLQAQALYDKGTRASFAKLVLSPLVRFLKFYVLRGGFLDGIPGLVHVTIGCFNSFCKAAKLAALWREGKRTSAGPGA
jgi:glycosyltransferase involved in cell wall biosynthesis